MQGIVHICNLIIRKLTQQDLKLKANLLWSIYTHDGRYLYKPYCIIMGVMTLISVPVTKCLGKSDYTKVTLQDVKEKAFNISTLKAEVRRALGV